MNIPHPHDLHAQLRSLDWYQFEKLAALIYQKRGFAVTRRGGAEADGGIDLILERDGERIAVQCKHWRRCKVGVKTVRELLGAMTAEQLPMGILVTLRGYTDAARQFAAEHGIELVNEARLTSLLESADIQTDTEFLRLLHEKRKVCPRCEREMVLRTAKRGPNNGAQFWGCSAFPACQFTMSHPTDSD